MDAFDRQIEQLRVLNDLNDMEKQDRELKLKSEQEALKQKQIVVSIGLLLVLMGLLTCLGIGRQLTVRNGESNRTDVVSDYTHGDVLLFVFSVLCA